MSEEVLFDFVGNPFVDAGVAGLTKLVKKNHPKDITMSDLNKAIGMLPTYFMQKKGMKFEQRWQGLMGCVYARNITFFNPIKPERVKQYATQFIDVLQPLGSKGTCILCGRRDAFRGENAISFEKIPLISSPGFANYNPSWQGSFSACAGCVLSMLFLPFGALAPINDNGNPSFVMVAHSPKKEIMLWLAEDVIAEVGIKTRMPGELINFYYPKDKEATIPGFSKIPAVTILRLISHFENRINETDSTRIDVYMITNSGQNSSVEVVRIQPNLFGFAINALKHFSGPFRQLLSQSCDGDIAHKRSNYISSRLINGEKILSNFLDRKNKRIHGNQKLAEMYAKEVLEVSENRLNAVREVGDQLWDYLKTLKSNKSKKELFAIERAKTMNEINAVLIRALKDGHPVIDLDQFARVFSDSKWQDARDLLLIHLYSKNLKEKILESSIEDEETPDEIIEDKEQNEPEEEQ